jgi:hypothetical protein
MNSLNIKSKVSYLILIVFLVLIVVLFFYFQYERIYRRYLVLLMSVFYFFWGIITQLKQGKLSKRVILEYLGVSFLAGLLLLLITF